MLSKRQREAIEAYLAVTSDLVEMTAVLVAKLPPELAPMRTLIALELDQASHDLRRARMHLQPYKMNT